MLSPRTILRLISNGRESAAVLVRCTNCEQPFIPAKLIEGRVPSHPGQIRDIPCAGSELEPIEVRKG